MNIIEAMKAGPRMTRPNRNFNSGLDGGWLRTDHQYYQLSKEDLLATDWIFEEQTIAITRSQLGLALDHCGVTSSQDVKNRIARELGFE